MTKVEVEMRATLNKAAWERKTSAEKEEHAAKIKAGKRAARETISSS